MKLKDILHEAVKLRRLDDENTPDDEFDIGEDDVESDDSTSDDSDEFDIGDDDSDDSVSDDEGNIEDSLPSQSIDDMTSDEPNLNQASLGSASVSTPTDDPFDDQDSESSDADGEDPDDEAIDAVSNKASEDPDKQGLIRQVKNARLIYKRETEDNTFEELWVYNTGNDKFKDSIAIRKAIVAGTDIPPSKTESPDGSQKYEIWSAGNAEMLKITGLPN